MTDVDDSEVAPSPTSRRHLPPVQPLHQFRHRRFEYLTDAEEGGDGDGASGLHLLPAADKEANSSACPPARNRFSYEVHVLWHPRAQVVLIHHNSEM